MKLFSADQIREWDSYTIKNEPISSINLMERASLSLANWIASNIKSNDKILILIGAGNNGGDGLAVGRILFKKGYDINLYCVENKNRSAENEANLLTVKELNIRIIRNINYSDYSVIIDAIIGGGLSRSISGDIEKLIKNVNSIGCKKIAIDCPSGIHTDNGPLSKTVFKSDYTLTLQQPKVSFFYKESADLIGETHVLDIGLSNTYYEEKNTNTFLIDESMCEIKKRSKFSHKGTYGHSLIIAGEMGKMGACYLTAKSALRSGSGLSTVLAPKDTQEILQSSLPEAMTISYSNNDKWSELIDLDKYQAIAIGPGIGKQSHRKKQLLELLKEIKNPIVLDADALNIIAENNLLKFIPKNSILTPHPGEFHRLFGKCNSSKEYIKLQRKISLDLKINIVHKLAHTIISDSSGNIYFNQTGNPGMATGGSGDILTGVITGLLAQGYSPIESAVRGVYHHGLAGDKCCNSKSETNMIAGDILDFLFID